MTIRSRSGSPTTSWNTKGSTSTTYTATGTPNTHLPGSSRGTASRRSNTVLIAPEPRPSGDVRVARFDLYRFDARATCGAFGITDDLLDLVILDVPGVCENDELAQQPE